MPVFADWNGLPAGLAEQIARSRLLEFARKKLGVSASTLPESAIIDAATLEATVQPDVITVVADATQRDALFPPGNVPANQRVQRLDTNFIERWSGAAWLQEVPTARTWPAGGRTAATLSEYLDNNKLANVKDWNAKGNGQWDGDQQNEIAGTCSIAAGGNVITSTRAIFTAAKFPTGTVVFSFDGAGPLVSGYRQALVGTLTRLTDFTAQTSVNAVNAVTNGVPAGSSVGKDNIARLVWGTDDTVAIDNAKATLNVWDGVTKSNVGGRLFFPPGLFLSLGHAFDGAIADLTHTAHNNIWVQGAGWGVTILEVYDPVNGVTPIHGAAVVPGRCDSPYNDPTADWMRGFQVSDISIRVVRNNSQPVNIIGLGATFDFRAWNVHAYGWSYEGISVGGHGFRGKLRDCVVKCAGLTGPTQGTTVAGFNIFAAEMIIDGCSAIKCGQGAEVSGHRSKWINNHFDATGLEVAAFATLSPIMGVNTGSTVDGLWGISFRGNVFTGYLAAITITNTIGTVHGTVIENNEINDGQINITSGLERNPVGGIDPAGPDPLTVAPYIYPHGDSSISNNTFITGTKAPSTQINIKKADLSATNACLESITIRGNRVIVPGMFCSGGTRDGLIALTTADCPGGGTPLSVCFILPDNYGPAWWAKSTVYAQDFYVVPRAENGLMYRCKVAGTSGTALNEPVWPTTLGATVVDNTVTWECAGKECKVTLGGNSVTGHPATKTESTAISSASVRMDIGHTRRSSFIFESHSQNYPWAIWCSAAADSFNGFPSELTPGGEIYSDRNRWPVSNALPDFGYYEAGTKINKSDGTRSNCTRTGRRGAAWAAGHAYVYGDRVRGLAADAGAIFECVIAGNSGGGEPAWNAAIGGTTVDNTVTWKAIAVSALFSAFA